MTEQSPKEAHTQIEVLIQIRELLKHQNFILTKMAAKEHIYIDPDGK